MAFERRFPRWVTAILAAALFFLTAAIIGLEFGSFYYDVAHGTIWIGFWAGLVFIKTSWMMICTTCCCRGRCFATYILIFIIFSGALACAIIYFDNYFMSNLCECYLPSNICCGLHGLSTFNGNYQNIVANCVSINDPSVSNLININTGVDQCSQSPPTNKLVFLKAQLGCAVGMLAVCVLYVFLYIFACFGVCFGHDKSTSRNGRNEYF